MLSVRLVRTRGVVNTPDRMLRVVEKTTIDPYDPHRVSGTRFEVPKLGPLVRANRTRRAGPMPREPEERFLVSEEWATEQPKRLFDPRFFVRLQLPFFSICETQIEIQGVDKRFIKKRKHGKEEN